MAKQLWYHGLTRPLQPEPSNSEGDVEVVSGITDVGVAVPFSSPGMSDPGLIIQTTAQARIMVAVAAMSQNRGVGLNAQLFLPRCWPVARPMYRRNIMNLRPSRDWR